LYIKLEHQIKNKTYHTQQVLKLNSSACSNIVSNKYIRNSTNNGFNNQFVAVMSTSY